MAIVSSAAVDKEGDVEHGVTNDAAVPAAGGFSVDVRVRRL